MVGSVVVRWEPLTHHAMVLPVVGARADVAGAEPESCGRHGLLHRGPIEQHRAVAGEPAVQLVSGALQVNTVSDRDQMLQPRGKSMQFSSKICINVEQVK